MTYNESTSEGLPWAVGNTASFLPAPLKRKPHRKEAHTLLNRQVEEQIGSLKQLYIFGDDEVKHILKKHPFLIQLLREARNEIERYFPDTPVLLEPATESEGADTDRVVGFIMTNLDPDTAIEILHRFDRGWWLNALKQAQGKLSMTLGFR